VRDNVTVAMMCYNDHNRHSLIIIYYNNNNSNVLRNNNIDINADILIIILVFF